MLGITGASLGERNATIQEQNSCTQHRTGQLPGTPAYTMFYPLDLANFSGVFRCQQSAMRIAIQEWTNGVRVGSLTGVLWSARPNKRAHANVLLVGLESLKGTRRPPDQRQPGVRGVEGLVGCGRGISSWNGGWPASGKVVTEDACAPRYFTGALLVWSD